MGRTYSQADMAAAWDSAYWHGTSHQGPLNSAAVNAKNPYLKTEKDRDASPKSVTASESTNS